MNFFRSFLLLLAVAALCCNGCIPSAPKQDAAKAAKPPVPAVSAPTAPTVPPASPAAPRQAAPPVAAAPAPGEAKLAMNMAPVHGAGGATAKVAAMKDSPGFTVEGQNMKHDAGATAADFTFKGTLLPASPDAKEWTLTGEFTFQGKGYAIGAPTTTAINDLNVGKNAGLVMSSTVMVSIPMKPLGANDPATPKASVTAKIPGAKNSNFMVVFTSG